MDSLTVVVFRGEQSGRPELIPSTRLDDLFVRSHDNALGRPAIPEKRGRKLHESGVAK
jgi:hypothetical protein